MKHRGVCAPGLDLRGDFRAHVCVSPTVRYVPIAGHPRHVSGLPGPGPSFTVSDHPRKPQQSDPHTHTHTYTARPSRAHLRSTLRNQHLSEDGRMDGCMDVDRCSRLTQRANEDHFK
ncbi:hypothetical protein ABVT39_001310 [Epinephelus coioides]